MACVNDFVSCNDYFDDNRYIFSLLLRNRDGPKRK